MPGDFTADWLQNEGESRGGEVADFFKDNRFDGYEETVIKKILQVAGVPYQLYACREDAQTYGGNGALNFAWFQATYPSFPAILFRGKCSRLHEITVAELFGPFTNLSFVKAFLAYRKKHQVNLATTSLAMVFNWGRVPGGQHMVLHNHSVDGLTKDPLSRAEHGYRVVRVFGNPPVTYTMEPLNGFLAGVGKGRAPC